MTWSTRKLFPFRFTHTAGMMLHLPRRRGHLLRPPLELEIHPLLVIRSIRVGHFQPCVGRDDGQLTEVLHDARFVGGPISGDEDLDFGSYPLFGIWFLGVLDDSGSVFVNVLFDCLIVFVVGSCLVGDCCVFQENL